MEKGSPDGHKITVHGKAASPRVECTEVFRGCSLKPPGSVGVVFFGTLEPFLVSFKTMLGGPEC